MTENVPLHPKYAALDLANRHLGESAEKIVQRAHAYHEFLSDAAVKATAGGATTKTETKVADKPVDTAAADKAAADKKAAAAAAAEKKGAAEKAAAEKKVAAEKAAAEKAAAAKTTTKTAAGATGAAVAADTKAPGGKNSYADVVAKLREVQNTEALGRDKAFEILAGKGGGVKSVRDLKPTAYDGVVAGCDAAIAALSGDDLGDPPEHTAGGLNAEDDPTAQPEVDELGMPV